MSRQHYLQERVAGTPGSILFLADGSRALALALSRQIVGERAFGAGGFRYCGSLMAAGGLFTAEDGLFSRASALADAVTREFGLVGLNGLDFIARAGVPWPIEVNPRWSASMELLDRSADVPLFALHAAACAGLLPETAPRPGRGVLGKAVVFARRGVVMGDTRPWLRDRAIADVPHPGERIRARTADLHGLRFRQLPCAPAFVPLASRAATIYRAVEPAARGAA